MYLLAAGYKTTAELIAESEQLKRRMERNNLLDANPAVSSVRSNTSAAPLCLFALVTLQFSFLSQAAPAVSSAVADFSLTSSTSFPRQLTAEEIQNNNEFHDLGVRSVRDRPGQWSAFFSTLASLKLSRVCMCHLFAAFDSLAASGPVGHQYHNFTHHLYHHYDPVTNVLDPMTQSLPIERPARASRVSIGVRACTCKWFLFPD